MSYWSDPLEEKHGKVVIRENANCIEVKIANEQIVLKATNPMKLHSSIWNCDIDLDQFDVTIEGGQIGRGRGIFQFGGDSVIDCRNLTVRAGTIVIGGSLAIRAKDAVDQGAPPNLSGQLEELYVSGTMETMEPWRTSAKILPKRSTPSTEHDWLVALIDECMIRCPITFYTNVNFEVDSQAANNWIRVRFGSVYQKFLRTLVGSGLATRKTASVSPPFNKVVALNDVDWEALGRACDTGHPTADTRINDFVHRVQRSKKRRM